MSEGGALVDLIARDLARGGVDTVFGLISDDTAFLANALVAAGIRLVGARHENMSIAMAEGYAAATGQLGVALIGRGPAAANCINAAVHASRTGSRVLLIYGDGSVEAHGAGGPDLKRLDLAALLASINMPVYTAASPDGLVAALRDATHHAGKGAATALLLPQDLLSSSNTASEVMPRSALREPLAKDSPDDQAIAAAAALIAGSRQPLVVAGWGAHNADARAAIERFGAAVGAAFCTTLRAKDFFAGNALDLGVIGSFSSSGARRVISECDCVIVFGASLNTYTVAGGEALPKGAPIIQVDLNPANLGRYWPSDAQIAGDAGMVAERLAAACGNQLRNTELRSVNSRAFIAAIDPSAEFEAAHTERTVDPRSAAIALNTALPRDRNVVLDIGNFFQIAPFLSVPNPGSFKYTAEFGSIGLGLGTAIGFAIGRPAVPTALFVGDGSLLMVLGELMTCSIEDLSIAVFVMNDAALGAERHFLDLSDQPIGNSLLPMVDFSEIAEQFGFETATVTRLAEIEALAPRLSALTGPMLVDIKINPAVAASFIVDHIQARRK